MSNFLENLPPNVLKRVEALKQIQSEHDEIKAKYLEERRALESKYQKLYQPLYAKRYDIVNGIVEVDGVSNEAANQGEDKLAGEKGVPDFWLTAMKTNEELTDSIQEKDEDALKYLKDIKWYRFNVPKADAKKGEASEGFKLEFFFDSNNPYFKNSVLTKAYFMIDEDDLTLEKAIGTEIDWFPGKSLTEKIVKKKKKPNKGSMNPYPITKTETINDSFFNLFSPPQVPDGDEIDEDTARELQCLMEQDYDIGIAIRDRIIPNAVSWFTGEAAQYFHSGDPDDDDDEEEEEEEDENDDDDDDDEGRQG